MDRRAFIALVSSSILATPRVAGTQQAPTVGVGCQTVSHPTPQGVATGLARVAIEDSTVAVIQ